MLLLLVLYCIIEELLGRVENQHQKYALEMNEPDLVKYILTQQLSLASSMSFTQEIPLLAIIYMLQGVICFTHNCFLSEFLKSLIKYILLIFHSL